MTMQCITHHGFRYCEEVKSAEEVETEAYRFEGWLYVLLVAGLIVFFVISFFML